MSNPKRHPQADLAVQIEQSWAAQGKLVEGAFQAYLILSNQTGVPEAQRKQMRNIWMLSAQHLFFTMIGRLSPGTEPDVADLRRFEAITREMRDFQVEMDQIKPQLKPRPPINVEGSDGGPMPGEQNGGKEPSQKH